MVEWSVFIAGLKKTLTNIKDDEEKVLQYILGTFLSSFLEIHLSSFKLDNSNTGFINQHKFSEFLKGFGQIQDCMKNVKSILSAK